MKKLINEVENVVSEQVKGLALANSDLKLVEDPCFIYHEKSQGKVSLVSGWSVVVTSLCTQALLERACLLQHVLVLYLLHRHRIR